MDMDDQPKYKQQASSDVIADGRASRLPIPGTDARGEMEEDDHFYRGYSRAVDANGKEQVTFFDSLPPQVELNQELLDRGQQRFNIYCSVCHGLDGYGNGPINARARCSGRSPNGSPPPIFMPMQFARGRMGIYSTRSPTAFATWPVTARADSAARSLGDRRVSAGLANQPGCSRIGRAGANITGNSMTSQPTTTPERIRLEVPFPRIQAIALFVGGFALLVAIFAGYFIDPSFKRFYFSYLISYAFFLSVSLGALFFVLIQHLTKAGWSVGVRRIAETFGCMFPLLAALSAPVVVSVILNHGDLYRWAQPVERIQSAETSSDEAKSANEELVEVIETKHAWLNPARFVICAALYFAVWSSIGGWFWKQSVQQDTLRDDSITLRMQKFAPIATIGLAITLTLGSFDFLMSLDPAWFSTMFGVYYFSGCAVAIFATLIVCIFILHRSGYLTQAVTIEHFHDLGKFLFAFTFFWGYIAFSQYMLLWYANMPETSGWFARRGATTVTGAANGYSVIAIMILFGHILIPMAGLMSRHVKRNEKTLVFWAVWMLVFHWIDLFWIVMPELDGKFHLGILDLLCLVGIGGVYIAGVLRIAARATACGRRPIRGSRSRWRLRIFE